MSSNFKITSIIHINDDERSKSSRIVQPRTRKSLVAINRSNILSSPTHKGANPEIIRPNCSCQTIGNVIQNEPDQTRTIHHHYSSSDLYLPRRFSQSPNQVHLDSLAPLTPKKNRQKKMRNSCSIDTSWSPDWINSEKYDEIRRKKSDNYSDDNQNNYNQIYIEQYPCATSDNQASPLCNSNIES